MSGATSNLPSLANVDLANGEASGGLMGFLGTISSLTGASGLGQSPLLSVTTALGGLGDKLNIDVSGISQRLPQAITTIQNALPEDALRYVEDIEQAYQALVDFLHDSELVKQIQQGGGAPQKVALAVVDDVLHLFQSHIATLASNLISADELTRVTQALKIIQDLATNPGAHAGDLLPFVSQQLLGVPPDLLNGVASHVGSALSVLDPLSDANLAATVTPARQAASLAFRDLLEAAKSFDVSNLAQYALLQDKVGAHQSALTAAFSALQTFYGAMQTVVSSHAWAAIFSTYRTLLDGISLEHIPSVDDAIDEMTAVLDDLLAKLTMTLAPDDAAERISGLAKRFREAFAQSPLGQVRQALTDFLERIRQAIEAVPTEEVRDAVVQMLRRVKQELEDLGISTIRSTIEKGFQDAKKFADDNLGSGSSLVTQIEQALAGVLQSLQQIPIADVGTQLTQAVGQVDTVIADLVKQLQSGLQQLKDLLAQLEDLSFKPVADEVIDEIDTLKDKLQSIKPNALSDVEKVAIRGTLAVLQAIDVEGMINTQLKRGFDELDDELKRLVNQILSAWKDLENRLGGFDPSKVMSPLHELVEQIESMVQKLNAGAVMTPLYHLLEDLQKQLSVLSPGSLLDPLEQPYAQLMALITRINPDVWVQPLRDLYTQVDRLLAFIDVRPILDTLEAKERELLAQTRKALTDGLDAMNLPAPLDAFYGTVKTVVSAVGDAIFSDPDAGIRSLNIDMRNAVSLSTLFSPLDAAFDRLQAALDGLPHDQLVSVMEALRTGIGVGIRTIDPSAIIGALRKGQAKLEDLSPAAAAAVIGLPALRANLAARLESAPPEAQAAATALLGKLDEAIQPLRMDVEGSALRALQASHQALVDSLRSQINALDATGATQAYTRLNANLGRLLPAFLQQDRPLIYDDVRDGLVELRPSHKALRLELRLPSFLARLTPIQDALNPAIDEFFKTLKDCVLLIHPGTIKGSVDSIYDTLRTKLHVLDPDALATELRNDVYEPLLDPLHAIDPSSLKKQLDDLYQELVKVLTSDVKAILDEIRKAVDVLLSQVREAVASVIGELEKAIGRILQRLQAVLKALDELAVVDLLGQLLRVLDNLETSFGQELDRVQHAFDAMLNAIPLGAGSAGAQVSA